MNDHFRQLFSVSAGEFLDRYFEREPLHGTFAARQLGAADLMAILPRALRDDRVTFQSTRLVADAGLPPGFTQDQSDAQLAARFQQQLERREYSYVLQSFETYHALARGWVDAVGSQFGCRASATAFLSPGRSRSTKAHYDNVDVFALQLEGSKTWDLYRPIDGLPDTRDPRKEFEDTAGFQHVLRCTLNAGEYLYVPRGWIHHVHNDGDQLSLHVSVVVFFDSWMSVFENASRKALVGLRREKTFGQSIGAGQMQAEQTSRLLAHFVRAFQRQLESISEEEWPRFLNHCRNHNAQLAQQASAKASLDLLDSEDALLVPSGIHYIIRHENDGVHISVDSEQFHQLPQALYHQCMRQEGVRLATLLTQAEADEEAVIRFIDIVVSKTGVCRLIPSAS